MRRAGTTQLVALVLLGMGGCANSNTLLKGNVEQLRQQQMTMARQNQELQGRAAALDRDNQELQKLLAQARQQTKEQDRVAQDQIKLLRNQLASITSQLAQVREEADKTRALNASLQRQRGVAIQPNNSLLATLPTINLAGVHVRRDGDVIRIELPADQLFGYGTSQFRPGAGRIITTVAEEILRNYPRQMIGIEGHTDSTPVQNYQVHNAMQLATAQAGAVYEVLANQTRLEPKQLFVVGHGLNHPVVSNATEAGRARNRRVELVIYPENRG